MSAKTLRSKLIRLAHAKPELRPHLLPILKTAARPIYEIAREISKDWGSKVNYAAKPYLQAMFDLRDVTDMYYADPASSIIMYFLGNARSWRGPVAKAIKAELKAMIR